MYNVEKYINQCVQTIINQTYSNIEIILVDDGSPDRSGEIAEQLKEKDERITVYHKANGGLSDARNYGMERANGDYFTFIDSDDFIDCRMIEQLVSLAQKHDAEFVECKNCRCSETDTPNSFTIQLREEEHVDIYTGEEKMKMFLDPHSVKTTAWAKLYARRLFKNIKYPVGKYHEDVYTTYKLVHIANKVVSTNYIGYIYRVNNNSITTSAFNPKRLDAINGKKEQAVFIEKEYPQYADLAYTHIVYACNSCLRGMGKSRYYDKKVMKQMQRYYNMYGKYYLRANVSISGKIFALLSMISVKSTYFLSKIVFN